MELMSHHAQSANMYPSADWLRKYAQNLLSSLGRSRTMLTEPLFAAWQQALLALNMPHDHCTAALLTIINSNASKFVPAAQI